MPFLTTEITAPSSASNVRPYFLVLDVEIVKSPDTVTCCVNSVNSLPFIVSVMSIFLNNR